MKTSPIQFRMVAYTDAAGKYNPEAVRDGNEDNFYVDDNLDDALTDHFKPNEIVPLEGSGLLMVVADGMGGMNAGEVASQMAIDTVREFFAHGKITSDIASSHEKRIAYMEKVIREADKRIKTEAANNPTHQGMGTTMILAWLYENELSISWCGDSRAYLFNQERGLTLISEDHSYVQDLVNKGVITYEQTFDHPQNNIVLRSVGDPSQNAVPDSRLFQVGKGDIILLCSDGLSGALRDKKICNDAGQYIDEPNIEDIIRTHTHSMLDCREALWQAAEANWYDNVTAILCQIMEGDEAVAPTIPALEEKKPLLEKTISLKKILIFLGIVILLGGAAWGLCHHFIPIPPDEGGDKGLSNDTIVVIDSIYQANTDSLKSAATSTVEEQIGVQKEGMEGGKKADTEEKGKKSSSPAKTTTPKKNKAPQSPIKEKEAEVKEAPVTPEESTEGEKLNNNQLTPISGEEKGNGLTPIGDKNASKQEGDSGLADDSGVASNTDVETP